MLSEELQSDIVLSLDSVWVVGNHDWEGVVPPSPTSILPGTLDWFHGFGKL
jgi:hypothetical protein